MATTRILLLEDDANIAKSLFLALGIEGFVLAHAETAKAAKVLLEASSFDLLLLDVGLPDQDGFSFCSDLRSQGIQLPVLFLTARGDEESVVRGLSLGALDYIRKPFSTRELVARIRTHFNRGPALKKPYQFETLLLDLEKRILTVEGRPVELNRREFEILEILMILPERVISRDEFLDRLDREGEVLDRAIDSHISRLRSKFKAAGIKRVQITAVYGTGYKLEKT